MKEMGNHAPPSVFHRGCIIDHYFLERLIGRGGYGVIYLARDMNDDEFYALKIEKKHSKMRGLAMELEILQFMNGSPYVPTLVNFGDDDEHQWIVMELMGPSINTLRWEARRSRFNKYYGFMVASEMLKCLEACHEFGFVHRDVKPSNFLLRGNTEYPISVVDFGLSRCYVDRETGEHLSARQTAAFVGTGKYASINAHEGKEQCRADDLIGWFYSIVEMIRGDLPWPMTRNRGILLKAKRRTPISKVCRKLPVQCIEIYEYINSLGYYDKPDYDRIHQLLNVARESSRHHRRYPWDKVSSRRLKKISPIDYRKEKGENRRVFDRKDDVEGPDIAICVVA
jgi:serine/threonine protein kinase